MQELFVDLFAGGGGASTGIMWAMGRDPDIAINHDPIAIAMHAANHPNTRHYCEDIFTVSPRKACQGRSVGGLWASPDCTHFSRARGGRPVEKKIRSLAWVVVRWARDVRPRKIFMENVPEFVTWGPVDANNRPIKERAGETFGKFINILRALGYIVDWRELTSCDYGAPTSRTRFVLQASCDGPIIWPEPTNGPRLKPYRAASEIINWGLPIPSIFATREEIKRQYGIAAQRPLQPATLERIARGIKKFVLDAPSPFLVPNSAPFLIQYHGLQGDNDVRGQRLNQPLMTVDTANRYGLVTAFIHKYYSGGYTGPGTPVTDPLPTVTAIDHNSVCAAYLTKLKGTNIGQSMRDPLQTITAGGLHFGQVTAFMLKYYGTNTGHSLNDPLQTITARDRFGLVIIHGEPYQICDIGLRMLTPRELYDAQGFSHDYIIDRGADGTPINRQEQVNKVGNSVSPQIAEALVRANLPDVCIKEVA